MGTNMIISFGVTEEEMLRIRQEARSRGEPHTAMVKAIFWAATKGLTEFPDAPLIRKRNGRQAMSIEELEVRVHGDIDPSVLELLEMWEPYAPPVEEPTPPPIRTLYPDT